MLPPTDIIKGCCVKLATSLHSEIMKKKLGQVRLGGRVSPEVAAIVIEKIRLLGFTYGDVANVGAFWEALASGRVSVNLVVTREELKKLSKKDCNKSGNQL